MGLQQLKQPLTKPPILYSQRNDNRDTRYLVNNRPDSREDRITMNSGAASLLVDKPPEM